MTAELEAARAILNGAQRVVAFTGAGISAESGLATFRASDGLWEGHHVEDVATPEAFQRNPALVWEFYAARRAAAQAAKPNPAHRALADWQTRFEIVDVVTQNVDGLHQRAGSVRTHELHGSLWTIDCRGCGASRADHQVPMPDALPRCERCGGLERPAIVWFGEGLPERVWDAAIAAIERCDALLAIGTSSVVYPAAGLVTFARQVGAKVIEINPNETPLSEVAHVALRGLAGEILPTL